MRIDMRIDTCIDMRIDVHIDTCADMCAAASMPSLAATSPPVSATSKPGVPRHVYRHAGAVCVCYICRCCSHGLESSESMASKPLALPSCSMASKPLALPRCSRCGSSVDVPAAFPAVLRSVLGRGAGRYCEVLPIGDSLGSLALLCLQEDYSRNGSGV